MRHAREYHLSIEDYLAGESDGEIRHEYVAGTVYAMTGGGRRHATITLNIASRLRDEARGSSCRVFAADMKLRVEAADAFYYPDVLITCEASDDDAYFMTAPCALVEVLSPSTASIDRREKLLAYRTLPSLREYLIVDPRRRHVILHHRDEGSAWHTALFEEGADRIAIACIDAALTLDEIYEDVSFPEVCEPWGDYEAFASSDL